MRSTFQNSGTALSIGIFFSLMIAGLASVLPATLHQGLTSQGVPGSTAHDISSLPPVVSLFSAILGVNPIGHALSSHGALGSLTDDQRATLTSRTFFPNLIAQPFHHGLEVVFGAAAVLSLLAAGAWALRGNQDPTHTRLVLEDS
jgi:hypothetical protein